MNLSKLLVSVNLAATLPIAVQVGAQAANPNSHGQANTLKDPVNTVASQAKHRSTQVSVANKNFNLVKAAASVSASRVEVDGVRLRAFVPGRKLPSSSDLQLVSQQPQMAPEASSLNGRVSESSSIPASSYNYAADLPKTPYFSSAPRVVLNQIQTVARQVKAANKKRNPSSMSRETSIAPLTASKSQSASADFGQYSKDIPASWMANEKNLSLIEPPVVAPKDMAQIDRMIDQAKPQEATGTAGPAPFPLNLLPQQSLKQFVGARPQNKITAPQAYFGSWHQNNQPRIAANLPPAGFRSNMHGGFGSYMAPHQQHKVASSKQQNKLLIAQAHHTAVPGMKVSAYAPYNTAAY